MKTSLRVGRGGILAVLACLLGVVLISGCSSLENSGSSESGGQDSVSSSRESGSVSTSDAGGELAAVDPGLPSTAAGDSGSSGDIEQKIIKTADLGLTSGDVRDTASAAQALAEDSGGNVMSSQLDQSEGRISAYLVLQVPSSEFEDILEQMRGLGKSVTTDAIQGQDVTEEFVDLQSRERNLLAAEQSLLDLYDEAEDVKGTLAIQRELTKVRGDIEQVQGRIRYLEQRTDYSQISLSVQPVAGAPEARPGWDPAAAVASSWSASLSVLQGATTALLSVIVFSWWLIPLFGLAIYLWRRRRSRVRPTPPPTEA